MVSPDDQKKAYGKAAIMNHPDKGDDPEELAQRYDLAVHMAMMDCRSGLVDALMERMMRGGREPDAVLPLMVSLETLYSGASLRLPFCRYVICSKCKGTGETIDDKDCCQQCKGEKVLEEKKVFEISVEKGMKTGQMISFPGEDHNAGGFNFILLQEEHPKFERYGDNLLVQHTLSLTEAQFGFQFQLTHLDNRQLIIKSEPGEVVKSGQFKEINDEGMPMYQMPFTRGKLYIHFTVEYPDSLTLDKDGDPVEDALKEGMRGGCEPNVVLPLMVSLETLYKGASVRLPCGHDVICSECKGTGETIDDKDCCQKCKGVKVCEEVKVFEVHVEKGMQSGQKIVFPGENFNTRGTVFLLLQEEHPKFQRNGDDLFVEHTLSLSESLLGFEFELTHLDNRQLTIKSQPGEVVRHGQFKEIKDEGMPVYKKPFMRGKLYIHFTVESPGSPTPDQSKVTEAVLPREGREMEVETATSPPRGV